MIPYIQPYFYAYSLDRLIAQYSVLAILIIDVTMIYDDLLENNDIIIKDRSGIVVYTIKSRPMPVDSNVSNMWASIC